MAEPRRLLDIAPAAIAKVIGAIVLVWLWLHLWRLLLLIIVALVLAIGLEPAVEWLERRRVPRAIAAGGIVLLLTVVVAGFFWITGATLLDQAREVGGRITDVRQRLSQITPPLIKDAIHSTGARPLDASMAAGYVMNAGRLVVGGGIVAILGLILTIYLLIEGRQTYTWLAAYAPPAHRARVHLTAREARAAIYDYVVANVATSVFAAVVVLVALTLLHVPAALLLALLAGVFDFVPVLGFVGSALPAVLLAMSRSPAVALAVAGVYAGYHIVENYYIAPKVYGERLRLSNLAVILAFAVGAEIGGVVGALLALPFASLYPVIERVWLKDYLNRDAIETHRRMQRDSGR